MSEALLSSDTSPEDRLARGILALQKVLTPQLKKEGEGYPAKGSYRGIGNYVSKNLLGSEAVEVRANLLTEEELEQHASVRIYDSSGLQYRIEVRDGTLADAYDQNDVRIEDEAVLNRLRAKLLRKRLAYRVLNLIKNPLK